MSDRLVTRSMYPQEAYGISDETVPVTWHQRRRCAAALAAIRRGADTQATGMVRLYAGPRWQAAVCCACLQLCLPTQQNPC